ncbi:MULTISPECIES: lysine-sensitive aspartokinase 3 [Morganella]|uniref:lysine-sensitive aspartokinase 3 n=1 Tax=Morganella TaxID=581 RepID=UPI0021D2A7F1|nr:lysine-sensitive aspartokinase 3 [Morganella morganii]ELA9089366.1 lysine-sensitive aspartokinase 3 [Morganella morganii]MCU6234062.1 lysine-sensitive aspartokinase 3 [Morganella morganii]MCU6275691.1 lysine-sensitive aspartokinase 3 [Morganella morganii]HED3891043.1 lysine-sensitive aspartokinase 3 [Morganella morganii]
MASASSAPAQQVIAKFGGTSVANYDAMQKSAGVVLQTPGVALVVLSASAGITNALIELAQGCPRAQREKCLKQIRDTQYEILSRLPENAAVHNEIDRLLGNITTLSDAAALATSSALVDEIVSHGEIMSTLLFTEVLREQGAQAQWFDVREVMQTDDSFGRAEPDTVVLRTCCDQLLAPRLSQGTVITQGFIGREAAGRTTTLGRGGSDYTAALLAEALGCQRVDIWTDVPGIYTTDPRIVPDAYPIDHITFDEAAEMANFGAKILHPATLLPAVRSGIPVFVGSSKESGAGGTLVCDNDPNPPLFRALTLRRQQTLLTLHSLKMLHARGFLAEIFTILSRHNISVDVITTSEVSIALTLDTVGSTHTNGTLLSDELTAELSALCRIEVEQDLALVAVIGNELTRAHGLGKTIFSALEPFNIRMISYGASGHNMCLLVPGNDAEDIIRALHRDLF